MSHSLVTGRIRTWSQFPKKTMLHVLDLYILKDLSSCHNLEIHSRAFSSALLAVPDTPRLPPCVSMWYPAHCPGLTPAASFTEFRIERATVFGLKLLHHHQQYLWISQNLERMRLCFTCMSQLRPQEKARFSWFLRERKSIRQIIKSMYLLKDHVDAPAFMAPSTLRLPVATDRHKQDLASITVDGPVVSLSQPSAHLCSWDKHHALTDVTREYTTIAEQIPDAGLG